MMSVDSESPYITRRRPFSQLQNIHSPSLSDNDGSSEPTTKKMLNNSGKPRPRLFAPSHSKLSKDFDVSCSSSQDSKNLESPPVTRPRSKPFTRRQRRESGNLFNVSFCSSGGESTKTNHQVDSPLMRPRPFTRSRGKENYNPFDISFISSSAENTSSNEISSVNSSIPKLFKNRNQVSNKRRSFVGNESTNSAQQKTNELLDDVTYMASPANSSIKELSLKMPRLFNKSRKSCENETMPLSNILNDLSYMSSVNDASSLASPTNSSIKESPFKMPRLFNKSRKSGKDETMPLSNILNDLSYMSSVNDVSSLASPTNSSIKESPFKMPRLFSKSRKSGEHETMPLSNILNDLSYISSVNDVSSLASPTNSSIKESPFKMPRLFSKSRKSGKDETMPLSNILNDLSYMSSVSDVSSLAPCDSSKSTTVSDAVEVDDVQRASMATRDEYIPELHISKLLNESTASSLNLSAACQAEENELLPKDNLDMLDASNLPNDSSSFLLTPCRRSKISTSDVLSPPKESAGDCSDNEADAVSIDERQEPFFRQVEISSTTMPDVSYNSSKLEISESNCNGNHRLFTNHRAAESAFIFNITYNSSIEPNEVSASSTTMTRSMSSSHLDNSVQNSITSAHGSHVDVMSSNTSQPNSEVSIQVNNVNDVSSSNTTITRSMIRRSLNNSQLDTSVERKKSNDKSVLHSSVVGHRKRVSMSTPKLVLNTTQPDISNIIPMNDNSIPNDSLINKSKSISMANRSVGSSRYDSTAKIESMDSSKLDTTKSHESIEFSKSRPFDKLQNKLESSQETPISTTKLPVAKKLFGRNSGLPDMSFSITYEESVDNTHENTPESLSSSSSEESVVSSEKSSEEESSSDEEEQEESKNEEEKEISCVEDILEKEETIKDLEKESSSVEDISEKEPTIEDLEKESSSVEDISEKEPTIEDLEKESSSVEDVSEKEVTTKDLEKTEVMDNHAIETEESSVVNSIDSYQHQDKEQESLNDVNSSFPEDNFNSSVTSQADSDVCRDASISITDKTFMSSQNNITVLRERPKCKEVTLPKPLDDLDDFKKSIEEKIASIRQKAIEKAENKHKFSYFPESPRAPKKNINKKVSTIKKYPRPKLFKPAHWANKRLYDYLSKCLQHKGLNRMLEAEKIVKLVHETIQLVTHSTAHQKNAIQRLKVELATQKIIVTTFDFYSFVREYLPRYFEEKVIPCVQPYTNTVWPPKDNIKESDPIII